AEITVGKDRSRPPALDDLRPSRADLFECLRPGYAREGAAAFAARAAQGVQDAVGAVNPLLVVVDFDAEPAGGKRMVGMAPPRPDAVLRDGHEHRTSVRAIVRTCRENGALCAIRFRQSSHCSSSLTRARTSRAGGTYRLRRAAEAPLGIVEVG